MTGISNCLDKGSGEIHRLLHHSNRDFTGSPIEIRNRDKKIFLWSQSRVSSECSRGRSPVTFSRKQTRSRAGFALRPAAGVSRLRRL